MDQDYPITRPSPGANPTIYSSFLTKREEASPKEESPLGHLFFSFLNSATLFDNVSTVEIFPPR
jgi:hypothetical protein